MAEVMREKLGNEESTEELEAIKDMAAIVFAASADTVCIRSRFVDPDF